MPDRIPTFKPHTHAGSRHREYDRFSRDAESKKFYWHSSSPWRRLRAMKLRRNPLCEVCLARGDLAAATIVHHVVERRADESLSLEIENLQSLCASCHSRVHAQGTSQGGDK